MARLVFVAYLVALWLLALLPLSATPPTTDRAWVASVPFETIAAALRRGLTVPGLVSVVGNIVAFVPLGWLGPVVLSALARGSASSRSAARCPARSR